MERRVIIFGTDHRYQYRDAEIGDGAHVTFRDTIRERARLLGLAALAEECNPMALEENGVRDTTVKLIADELGIPHHYCDPDRSARVQLGIFQENDIRAKAFFANWSEDLIQEKLRESFDKRESYWAAELINFDVWPVLFICGANHVEAFKIVLQNHGLDYEVAEHDWSA